MRSLIIVIIFILVLPSCRNRHTDRDNENKQSLPVKDYFILHPAIMEIIKEIRVDAQAIGEYDSFDEVEAVKEIREDAQEYKTYAVYFTDDQKYLPVSNPNFDTLIYVSLLREGKTFIEDISYKGVLSIDSLTIAVFDKVDFGGNYYDSAKLSPTSLDLLDRFPNDKRSSISAIDVSDGNLTRIVGP